MRYYDIVITDPASGSVTAEYSSYVSGRTLPNALNVELDAQVFPFATPMARSFVRIWGIGLQEISQARNLVNKRLTLSAGFQAGLPLANPAQSGVLLQGTIFQALGNWIGTDMTLDLFVFPETGTPTQPQNLILLWISGVTLESAIRQTLSTAFPAYQLDINVDPNLITSRTETGYYASLVELARWVKQKSLDVLNPTGTSAYQGVDISIMQNTIRVYDGTTPKTPKTILFQDLIGQPTWIDAPSIQFKTPMRADLSAGDYVTLPPSLVTTTPGSLLGTPARSQSVFQGTYQLTVCRHVGCFRQPTAESWVSVFDAIPVPV